MEVFGSMGASRHPIAEALHISSDPETIIEAILELLLKNLDTPRPSPRICEMSWLTWLFFYWEIRHIQSDKDLPIQALLDDQAAFETAAEAAVDRDPLTDYVLQELPPLEALHKAFPERRSFGSKPPAAASGFSLQQVRAGYMFLARDGVEPPIMSESRGSLQRKVHRILHRQMEDNDKFQALVEFFRDVLPEDLPAPRELGLTTEPWLLLYWTLRARQQGKKRLSTEEARRDYPWDKSRQIDDIISPLFEYASRAYPFSVFTDRPIEGDVPRPSTPIRSGTTLFCCWKC